MCNGIKTKIAQSFRQSICTCCYDYMLLLILLLKFLLLRYSHVQLHYLILFLSLSLFFVLCVIHRRRFTATYYYFILVSGIVHTLHSVDFCGLSRGVFHFFTSSVTGFIFTFSQCSNSIHSYFVVFHISLSYSGSLSPSL